MKRITFIMIFLAIAACGAFGWQLNVTGEWSMAHPEYDVISSARDGLAEHKGGLGTEFILDHVGFGSSLLLGFADTGKDSWTTDWDLRTFLGYHFFSERRFFDPFIRGGVGAFGDFDVTGDYCSEEDEYPEVDRVAVALYPYLAAGVGLRFRGGLYLSGDFNWRPISGTLSCWEGIESPSLNEFEVVLALGYTFGSGKRR